MAIIKKDYANKRNSKLQSDLRLQLVSRAHGSTFEFSVKRNRVEIACTNEARPGPDGAKYNNWRTELSETEKLRVFALVLDEYRKHSVGDEHGYRGAVLGVTHDGQIFLGANTAMEQVTSPYFKECAEQNMVSAALDLVAYQQVKKTGWDKFQPPKAPVFESVYMMGGIDQGKVTVSCPCGKCTDMLAKNMAKGAKVYALPILTADTFNKLNEFGNFPIEVDRSQTLATVRERVSQVLAKRQETLFEEYPVWQTSIDHLNAHRELSLDNGKQHLAAMQRDAYELLCKKIKSPDAIAGNEAVNAHNAAIRLAEKDPQNTKNPLDLFQKIVGSVTQQAQQFSQKMAEALGIKYNLAVKYAAANQFFSRHSIAELDASSAHGPNLEAINRFMLGELRHIGANRISHDPSLKKIWSKTVGKAIPHLRCVVIQLDDGTFHYGVESAGKYDASLPNAEAVAVANALPELGNAGIRDVWVMEANGQAISRGVLPTSPKEGVERIVKRASPHGVRFHYLPPCVR
jgi:cytidine deaminase